MGGKERQERKEKKGRQGMYIHLRTSLITRLLTWWKYIIIFFLGLAFLYRVKREKCRTRLVPMLLFAV